MTASAGQSVFPICEPQTYLVGPGFFAHLWRDRRSAQAWNKSSAQFRMFEEVILKARRDGDQHRLKEAVDARQDLTAELESKYGRPIRQRCYRTDRLSWLVEDGVDPATDNWISQGIFRRRNRRIVNLRCISVNFADLDYYKLPELADRPADSVVRALKLACGDRGLPQPSLILDSGRGLQVKWLLDTAVPAAALPRWQAVQNEIGRQLADFGADAQARDASRVLRLERTTNAKARRIVKVVDYQPVRYDFELLCLKVLPFTAEEVHPQTTEREEDRLESEAGARPRDLAAGGMHHWGPRHLNWDRYQDLVRLAELRSWDSDGVPEGARDSFLFWALNFFLGSRVVTNPREFWLEAEALVANYCPHWFENWRGFMKSLYQRVFELKIGAYRVRNQRLIDLFEITSYEERCLCTIISSDTARQRDRERHRVVPGRTREQYLEQAGRRRAEAVQLRSSGMSYRKIARRLACSPAEVFRLIRGEGV
jgi:hypothetical protein